MAPGGRADVGGDELDRFGAAGRGRPAARPHGGHPLAGRSAARAPRRRRVPRADRRRPAVRHVLGRWPRRPTPRSPSSTGSAGPSLVADVRRSLATTPAPRSRRCDAPSRYRPRRGRPCPCRRRVRRRHPPPRRRRAARSSWRGRRGRPRRGVTPRTAVAGRRRAIIAAMGRRRRRTSAGRAPSSSATARPRSSARSGRPMRRRSPRSTSASRPRASTAATSRPSRT